MKYYSFGLFTILLVSSLFAQDTWVQTYRPFQRLYWTDRYDVEDVVVTQDGGYVVSGSYELFGYDPWEYENWGFLMKTDSDGNLLWAVNDSVDFMLNNGYYLDFTELPDGSLLSIGGQGYGGGRYMIKRDSDGNRQWAVPYNTEIGVFSMKTTTDGNVILAGRSDYNAALRKITPDGETIWNSVIYVGSSIAYSVTQSSDGGYFLTGTYYEDYDVLVIKTDEDGDSLWTKTFEGLDGHEQGNCIIETSDGNILVTGYFRTSSYDRFGMLSKLNTNGNTIFLNQYELWNIRSCIEDIDNNYVINSGYAMLKTNDYGDTLWCAGIPYWGYFGDRCFQRLEDGFLCLNKDDFDYIQLTKTDHLGQVTDINECTIAENSEIPLQNYPNPFNPSTIIEFSIQNDSNVKLSIYNNKGQKIKTLAQNEFASGTHSIIWNGVDESNNSVSSGIYYYKLNVNGKTEAVKRCLLLK